MVLILNIGDASSACTDIWVDSFCLDGLVPLPLRSVWYISFVWCDLFLFLTLNKFCSPWSLKNVNMFRMKHGALPGNLTHTDPLLHLTETSVDLGGSFLGCRRLQITALMMSKQILSDKWDFKQINEISQPHESRGSTGKLQMSFISDSLRFFFFPEIFWVMSLFASGCSF